MSRAFFANTLLETKLAHVDVLVRHRAFLQSRETRCVVVIAREGKKKRMKTMKNLTEHKRGI